MFSRRPIPSHNRGRIPRPAPTTAAPWTPANISSVTKYFWLRADLGVTESGGALSAISDQYGLNNFAQASGGNRPTWSASDADVDGQASILFDGSDDFIISATLDLPIPSVGAPLYFWFIFRQVSWTINRIVMRGLTSGATASLMLQQSTASPGINMSNGTSVNLNNGALIGSTVRGTSLWTNSVADRLVFAGTSQTGANAGNRDQAAGSFAIGNNSAGTSATNIKLAEILCLGGEPTEIAMLEAYAAARYPTCLFA